VTDLSTLIELKLQGGPQAAGQAREEIVADNGTLPASVRDELLLLLTELVTNAVRHGGAVDGLPVEVVVARSPRALKVAVTDPGSGFEWPVPDASIAPRENGYGLLLVDRLAHRWGIERGQSSTTVWFELLQA
jgi:anti-sigma regulatory factor (Ser/Thr protein kinase)